MEVGILISSNMEVVIFEIEWEIAIPISSGAEVAVHLFEGVPSSPVSFRK